MSLDKYGPQLRRLAGGRDVRRVMFFGKSMSRTRCTGALVDALRQHGLDVRWYNLATYRRWFARIGLGRKRAEAFVLNAWRRYRPDMVFVFCRDLPVPMMETMRQHSRVVLWIEEALEDIDRDHVDYMGRADVVCMSNPSHFAWLEAQGLSNMMFLMSGFSPRFHQPDPRREPERDVAFIGAPGKVGQRAAFMARVSERFDTDVFGLGWSGYEKKHPNLRICKPIANRDYAKICASSRIVMGINEVNDYPLYFSNRTWLTLGCRGFHMTHYVPGLEDVFDNHKHLVWFHDADEALEQVDYYLKHENERERIARQGHEFATNEHQYFHRVGEILDHLRTGQKSRSERSLLQRVPALMGDGVASQPTPTASN